MKAVIVQDAQLLTTEAQNAMLKILEEPPAQTLLLLTADSKEALLPTICSRCRIITLSTPKSLSEKELMEYEQVFHLLLHISVPDSLKLAESLSKNKEEALLWLEKTILLSRLKMLEDSRFAAVVHALQQTHTMLKTTNVNARFALERLFLSFVSSDR